MNAVLEWVRSWAAVYFEFRGYYVLPLVGIALVLLHAWLSSAAAARRLSPAGLRATRGASLAVLVMAALFSAGVYNNFLNFHYSGYLNAYEFFHYYLGSKYAPEVGYFDMYGATLAADDDTGLVYRPDDGALTDLRTHGYVRVEEVLANAPQYRETFTEQRWHAWVGDVYFFKKRLGPTAWNRVLHDKGYNATPAWTAVVGTLFTSRVPTSNETGLVLLALLDVLLLSVAIGGVAWAFGRWPALLMIVFIASSYLMAHVHMKGALLRTDFVVGLVLAVCLEKRGHSMLAGALVGYAAMSRLFPVVFLLGPAVLLIRAVWPAARNALREAVSPRDAVARGRVALAAIAALAGGALLAAGSWWLLGPGLQRHAVRICGSVAACLVAATLVWTALIPGVALVVHAHRSRQLDPRPLRFFAGFGATVVALFAASLLYSGDTRIWSNFADKISLHRSQPHIWDLGFTTVVTGELVPQDGDRHGLLPEARLRPALLEDHEVAIGVVRFVALALSMVAMYGIAGYRALALGFVPLFFLVSPTYYYYIVLLLPFLFFADRLTRVQGVVGCSYLFVFGMVGHGLYQGWDQQFTTYYWNAVMALVLAVGMLAIALVEPWRHGSNHRPFGSAAERDR